MPRSPCGGDEVVEVVDGAQTRDGWRRGRPPRCRWPTAIRRRRARLSRELLRPLRCTLPIGWIGGRYTTSKPILAMRGSASAAVANVPCTGLPLASQPPVDRGNISYHELNRASGRSTQTPYCSPRVTSSRSGYCCQQLGRPPGASASAVAGQRVTGRAQRRRGLQQRVAQLARQARGGALEQPRADHEVVGQLGFTLAGVELGVTRMPPGRDRIAPAVHPEGPQTDAVRGELTVEHVRRPARRHRDAAAA